MENARLWFLRAGSRFYIAILILSFALIFGRPTLGGDNRSDQPALDENTAEVHQERTEATIEWKSAEPSTSQLFFGSTEVLEHTSTLDTKLVTEHHVVINGLTPAPVYHFQPVSQNGHGVIVHSGLGIFSTTHGGSGMPWGVSIASPLNGAQVSGSVQIQATAAESVTNIQFVVDGKAVGQTLTKEPFQLSLNTTGYSNGSHILMVKAQGATGLQLFSWPIWIRVRNGGKPSDLSVTITSPGTGATVSGTTQIQSNAVDANSVQFTLDGHSLGAPITAAPYAYSWNTAGAANGSHTLLAVASGPSGSTSS